MRINYLEQGHGPPLVFLHGIGGGAAGWQPQLEEFGRTHHAIAWDMPGYGASTPLTPPTFAGFAQSLHNFLSDHAIQRPILVGHSLGGMIVQEYLATFPGQAAAAVLYGTSPAFGSKDGAWQQEFMRARLGPLDQGKTMSELAPMLVQTMVGSAAQPAGIALATTLMAATSAETYRATMLCLLEFDRRAALSKIDIPCLLVTGAEDGNSPPSVMERMATKIAGSRFVILPGLGHLAHMEDPQAFNRCLAEFLQ